QQHPVNPIILEILIQTIKITKHQTENIKTTSCKSYNPGHPDSDNYQLPNTKQKIYQQHPVNPIILEILIQTIKITKHQTENIKTTSCKSYNPGHPDSDNFPIP
ncbi:hypothetical protein, partial [Dolichospermum sp. UHCC 0352]|uniref:hypothetical protein n=1 Tax=Dolichospermum sp. UHCC 0352 TaxID=2590011 RepID=UPI001444C12C